MTAPSRMIREAAALGAAARETEEFTSLLIDALAEDPEARAAVQNALRRDPPPRPRGGARRG